MDKQVFHIFAHKLEKTDMNDRERQLIEGIINTGDRRIHNRCIQLLFHGQDTAKRDERVLYKKNDYVVALENAVRTNFSGRHYQGLFSETYMVFESLFATYLEHLNPEKLHEIEDLKNWLFVTAGRFCNSNRKKINELLGIELGDNYEEYDDGLKAKENDSNSIEEESLPQVETSGIIIKKFDGNVDSEPTDDLTDQPDTSDWAASLLNIYIGKINNEYYRDLIRAIKIEGVPVETIAEEYNKSEDDIYRDYNRAWDKLLQVTLPDIKIRSKSLFKKYESKLDDQQARILNKFFFGGYDISAIARSEKINQNELERVIVKTYKVLLRTAKHETEFDEKEKRKEAREQRHLEKEEASKGKKS